ncbi:MAG: IMP cyclohydrolase [Armatimonadota bacterium]
MYVGRIVAVGMGRKPFAAYRVSSRSFPNRIAKITDVGVAIQPLDPEDIKKNPYIAYNCLRVSKNGIVVSNGSHTDPIFEALEAGASPDIALQDVLSTMGYEKDDFNTPRIAGVLTESLGYLGTVRIDAVEVTSFALEPNTCQFVCTYEIDKIEGNNHPFIAVDAQSAAKHIFEEGIFADLELPVCSASWMDDFAVYNPHQK